MNDLAVNAVLMRLIDFLVQDATEMRSLVRMLQGRISAMEAGLKDEKGSPAPGAIIGPDTP